jgi:hypothetical protein
MACHTRITISCCPSKRVNSAGLECVQSLPFQDGPLPRRTLDVDGLKGCHEAFDAYVAEVKATGKGATCFASVVRGFRTPPGFKQCRWQREVNLDAHHPELV